MSFDLATIWALLILLGVAIYTITDGFDLGVGMLFPLMRSDHERDQLMNSVAPVWDGNETWMVLGGAALFGAFPMIYSLLLSALYLPIIFMLIALIFRGVSFEFRARATDRARPYWDFAFFFGSLIATLFQGVIAGAFISGFPVMDGVYSGGAWDWLTPFNLLAGVAILFFYLLLGATWLIKKSEGVVQERIYKVVNKIALTFGVLALLLFIMTLIKHRLSIPSGKYPIYLALLIFTLLFGYLFRSSVKQHHADWKPFFLTVGFALLGAIALVVTIWPYVLPFDLTIWEAAAPESSLRFTIIGAFIFLPIVIAYNLFIYYIFRGKVQEGEGY